MHLVKVALTPAIVGLSAELIGACLLPFESGRNDIRWSGWLRPKVFGCSCEFHSDLFNPNGVPVETDAKVCHGIYSDGCSHPSAERAEGVVRHLLEGTVLCGAFLNMYLHAGFVQAPSMRSWIWALHVRAAVVGGLCRGRVSALPICFPCTAEAKQDGVWV